MITIEDFYSVSETNESMYDTQALESVKAGLSKIERPEQLLPYAEFVIRINANYPKSRALRKAADKLLLRLASEGSAEHQCAIGSLILDREFTLIKSDSPATDALPWLMKSYRQGYADAAVVLYTLYSENRIGSPRNPELCRYYADEAKRLGSKVYFGDNL